ncbi:MAG: FtsX-like permease family protein [Acidobacteria bacterium]|nr:FtsX-like permease family protein [Acidobacteriota bacterium]
MGSDRAAEMSTRASLGAGRGRLTRHLVTETVVLFATGGAAGLLFAVWLAKEIAAIASFDIPRMNETQVDWQVAAVSVGLTCVAGLFVGLVPGCAPARSGVAGHGVASRAVTHHRRGRLVQRLLIASEIGLALVLVCGAGAIGSHASALSAELAGFDVARLVQARVTLPIDQVLMCPHSRSSSRNCSRGFVRTRQSPRPESPTSPGRKPRARAPPVLLGNEPRRVAAGSSRPAAVRVVSEGYLETLGLQPLAGRLLRASDKGRATGGRGERDVRSHAFAGSPVGGHLRLTLDGLTDLDTADRRSSVSSPTSRKTSCIVRRHQPSTSPLTQGEASRMAIVIRAAAEDAELGPVIRAELAGVGPASRERVGDAAGELDGGEFARTRLSLRLVGGLALIAVVPCHRRCLRRHRA